jgi:glycerol-3-phosphate dehydrogenase
MARLRVAVVGAGVVGSLIARELTRYNAYVMLFEREPDVGWGVTKANSAIIHGCFHEKPGSERARFCIDGNRLYEHISHDLDIPLRKIGAYVIALDDQQVHALEKLYKQGVANQTPGLEIHDKKNVLAREPNLNPSLVAGLWSPSVAITEPWAIAIAAVENATSNGLELHVEEKVIAIETSSNHVQQVITNKRQYKVDAVVNAAGLFSDRIAEMVGLSGPTIYPRRGQYILLDKKAGSLISSVIFPAPDVVSKGILVVPTIDGGVLLGPTAEDLERKQKDAVETTRDGLLQVIDGVRKLVPRIDLSLVVKTFSGLRPETQDNKFVIGKTDVAGFFQAAGMRSPGLTAAPSIASFLVNDIMAQELDLTTKELFNPTRQAIPRTMDLTEIEANKLIASNPHYGKLICQCNQVTEGEIVDAIHRGAHTLDGVKFRTRAGFGRCQGGFCTDKILMILARELNVSPTDITLRGGESSVVDRLLRQ